MIDAITGRPSRGVGFAKALSCTLSSHVGLMILRRVLVKFTSDVVFKFADGLILDEGPISANGPLVG